MADDELRKSILARRRTFIGLALAMGAVGGGAACGTEPSVCLEPVPTCVPNDDKAYELAQSSEACVGKIVVLRNVELSGCGAREDVTARTVFATSDPTRLVIEGSTARALATGSVTITALIDGKPVATTELTITECAIDAATD